MSSFEVTAVIWWCPPHPSVTSLFVYLHTFFLLYRQNQLKINFLIVFFCSDNLGLAYSNIAY